MQTRLKGLRAHASEADVPAGLTSVLLMKPLDEALMLLQLGRHWRVVNRRSIPSVVAQMLPTELEQLLGNRVIVRAARFF